MNHLQMIHMKCQDLPSTVVNGALRAKNDRTSSEVCKAHFLKQLLGLPP